MAEKKKYRVLHPSHLGPGEIILLNYRTKEGKLLTFGEGDVFEKPVGFDADGRVLREGFYEEVKDG